MSLTDNHRRCCDVANSETFRKFSIQGPYDPGTHVHAYWLSIYDREMKKWINGLVD